MQHQMSLNPNDFEKVRSGQKTIERRLFDRKRQKIRISDIVTFHKSPEKKEAITVEVIGFSRFNSLAGLNNAFDPTLFGDSTDITLEKQLADLYEYYSKEKEQKYGVLGIHIQLVE